MEHLRQDQIQDLSLSPPAVGSIQIAGSNGFGHNIEFMSQAYLRNRSLEINIEVEDDTSITDKDQPLPIFLKFADVEYKVKISQASSNNPIKEVVSKVASQFEHDNYKQILKVRRRKGKIHALMGPSGSGKTTLLKILGERLQENVRETATYNDIPYNTAINRRENPGMHMLFSGLKEEVSTAICGMAAVAKKEDAYSALSRKGAVRKGRLSYGNKPPASKIGRVSVLLRRNTQLLGSASIMRREEQTIESLNSYLPKGCNGHRPPPCDYIEEFFPPFEFSSERVQAIGKSPVSLSIYDVYPEAAFLEVAFP
ncbi:ABC transporter G family member 26 [Capsicum chinense]|nr:ABC transporter G family member 26 [Capsicum chinense]